MSYALALARAEIFAAPPRARAPLALGVSAPPPARVDSPGASAPGAAHALSLAAVRPPIAMMTTTAELVQQPF